MMGARTTGDWRSQKKRRWLFVALLVGALVVGITGGSVLAQGSATSGNSPFKSFASRVAALLGVDEAKVQDAFKQAAKEMQDEALQQRLSSMVQQGRLTQEQADQIKTWYQSRPDALSQGFPMGGFGGHRFHRGMMQGGPMWHMETPPITAPQTSGTSS